MTTQLEWSPTPPRIVEAMNEVARLMAHVEGRLTVVSELLDGQLYGDRAEAVEKFVDQYSTEAVEKLAMIRGILWAMPERDE